MGVIVAGSRWTRRPGASRCRAICLLARPFTTCRSTCCSRALSPSAGGPAGGQQRPGDPRVEWRMPLRGGADGGHQLPRLAVFEQVAEPAVIKEETCPANRAGFMLSAFP